MRTRRLIAVLAATGIALATASCGSAEDGDSAPAGNDAANSSQGSAPQASSQQLLLTAQEFPSDGGFNTLPKSATDQALESMKLPEGATVTPAECADKATAFDKLTSGGEYAAIAGNSESGALMVTDAVIKNGPSVAEARSANEQCPRVEYKMGDTESKATVKIGEDPRVAGASDALAYTMTSKGMDIEVSMAQYGIAAEVNGVVILVAVTSLKDSDEVSDEAKSQVLEIANVQAAKITDAA
ncbi:DUF5642 family protein [Gordonia zhaorongruii]|uniref:DUF5642 family protein n=1 Tax=Gordonia zhaorongruii TaxID=2597659 RepID=UPI00117D1D97|nr:DUF5642 family protein [Gordonia zhaorongruii]